MFAITTSIQLISLRCFSLSLFELLYLLIASHNYSSEPTGKMVNWKAADAKERLFASLLASHPSLKVHFKPPSSIK